MKKALLFILFFITITVAAGLVTLTDSSMQPFSVVELNGEKTVEIEVFGEYEELGCTATEGNRFIGFSPIEYETVTDLDTNVIGEYKVRYKTLGETAAVETERTVRVLDRTAPVITAPDEITEFTGTTVFNFQYTAIDNYNGDLSESVLCTLENDVITLTVSDFSGNKATKDVKVNYVDDVTPPVITLKGFASCHVKKGGEYKDPGYSAKDNRDGNVTKNVTVTGAVDTATVGSYELVYSVTDEFGNTGTATRFVNVYESPMTDEGNGPVIYLTFDDGPGKYTEKLLNILSEYGVKATFFVTNQFPKYQDLIGRAYNEGHSIGVHTYSHQWTVYESKEAYFADFTAMNEIIKNQTGQYSKIFRFPGGSSNVVSKQYSSGIITELSKDLKKSGYLVYDWHIDCADTVHKTSGAVFNQVKKSLKTDRPNIILMHDIKLHTVNAVPQIIEYALANGYRFAVIDENTPTHQLTIAN